jgi:hypothetical protein
MLRPSKGQMASRRKSIQFSHVLHVELGLELLHLSNTFVLLIFQALSIFLSQRVNASFLTTAKQLTDTFTCR